MLIGENAWVARFAPECSFVRCQPIRLQLDGFSIVILTYEHKVPVIGDQHLPVFVPILGYLATVGSNPGVIARGFDLDDTLVGRLAH